MTTLEPEPAAEKARLSFHVTGLEKDYSRRPRGIPVEVRHDDLTVAAEVLTTETVDLDPGTYVVMVQLPEGGELMEAITLSADESAELQLSPPSFTQAPERSAAGGASMTGLPIWEEADKGLEMFIRVAAGNVLTREQTFHTPETSPVQLQVDQQAPEYWKITRSPYDTPRPILVQCGLPESPVWNIALPPGAFLQLAHPTARTPTIRIGFDEEALDEFIQYRSRGLLREARSMALALKAEDLLYQKVQNPIGAAVGAYALLAFGELDRLHHWTENLMNWFDRLPDGLVIRGEHLARLGEHAEAMTYFATLPERGLPLFSDGMNFALRRLRYYRSVGSETFPAEAVARARQTLTRLEAFAPFLDLRRPLTSFTGVDPGNPDAFVPSASEMNQNSWQTISE